MVVKSIGNKVIINHFYEQIHDHHKTYFYFGRFNILYIILALVEEVMICKKKCYLLGILEIYR